jgi:hypothetical protein
MSSFYASSALKIRLGFPAQHPALGDADFPGSITIMRSAWGTANESAVFLLHGDSNIDHSRFQRGSPSIFLLGAPVCICFGDMYSLASKLNGPWTGCSTYVPVITARHIPPLALLVVTAAVAQLTASGSIL